MLLAVVVRFEVAHCLIVKSINEQLIFVQLNFILMGYIPWKNCNISFMCVLHYIFALITRQFNSLHKLKDVQLKSSVQNIKCVWYWNAYKYARLHVCVVPVDLNAFGFNFFLKFLSCIHSAISFYTCYSNAPNRSF